jgi:hypothetical protein
MMLTIDGIASTAPMYSSGGRTRKDAMSSRNSCVSRSASLTQSCPVATARSSSGSSTSVTFWTYRTARPPSRQTRWMVSNRRYVAAWPKWVASYGVMPQTYIRTGSPCAPISTCVRDAES